MAPRDLAHAIARLLGGPQAAPAAVDGWLAALVAVAAVLGVALAVYFTIGGPAKWR